jgi:chromosome partitioning protein
MIILVGNEKGGVGKSTIAINLAVAFTLQNKDVLLVDTDIQSTASNFVAKRNEQASLPKINCVQKRGDVLQTLKDLKNRYEIVIVDAGGQDSIELRSAITAADIVIVPLKPSQIDLWAVDRMNKLIEHAKCFNTTLKTFCVLSMTLTNPRVTEINDAKEMLQDYKEFTLLNTCINDRKIYRDSIIEGKGVMEIVKQNKAANEIESLLKEVK